MTTPSRSIDHALWVFNANANRKGFGLHVDAALVQQGERVACAVTQCKDHMLCGQMCLGTRVAIFHVQACDLSAC